MDQLLIWCHKVPRDNNIPKKLSTVRSHPLKIYQCHIAVVKVQDCFKNVSKDQYTLLKTNIGDVGMILGQAWLNQVDSDICWAKDLTFFCQQEFHNWNKPQKNFWVHTPRLRVPVPDPTVDVISFSHLRFKWDLLQQTLSINKLKHAKQTPALKKTPTSQLFKAYVSRNRNLILNCTQTPILYLSVVDKLTREVV